MYFDEEEKRCDRVTFTNRLIFAVLEKHEVERLIDALKWAIGGCKQERDAFE